MQVVIPIAGKGKRMAEAGIGGPKQLLPVAGKPLVEHTLARLPSAVDELVLVVGGTYEPAIRDYFGAEHAGRKVTFVQQEEQKGLGHAVQQAAPVIRGKFLVVLPDDIYAPEDLQSLVEGPDLAALAKRVDAWQNFGVLVCDAEGCLIDAVEKPKTFVSDLVSTGAYLLDDELFAVRVPPSSRGEIELPDLVLALARERGRRIRVLEARFWVAVNDPQQLTAAEQALLHRGAPPPEQATSLRGAAAPKQSPSVAASGA